MNSPSTHRCVLSTDAQVWIINSMIFTGKGEVVAMQDVPTDQAKKLSDILLKIGPTFSGHYKMDPATDLRLNWVPPLPT